MPSKIIVIEDDLSLAKLLAKNLTNFNFQVQIVHNLNCAYHHFEHDKYDLAIVDHKLPDGEGTELVQYLHQNFYSTHIIYFSPYQDEALKLACLELGAQDVICKHNSLKELLLKVKILLKTQKIKNQQKFNLAAMIYYPEEGLIKINQHQATLRKKENDILHCLFTYKNQIVTREVLINWAWGESSIMPYQNAIEVHMRRIRQKMGEYSHLIKTIRGFGYKLIS